MVVTRVIESVEGCLIGIDGVTGKMTPIDELEDLTPIAFEEADHPLIVNFNDHNHKIHEANKILEDKRAKKRCLGLDAAFEEAVTHCARAAEVLFRAGWFRPTLPEYNAVNVTLQPSGFNVSMDYVARRSFPTVGGARAEDALPTTIPEDEDEDAFSTTLMMLPPHQKNNNNQKPKVVGQLTLASALSLDDVFLGEDGRLMQASTFLSPCIEHSSMGNNRALTLANEIMETLNGTTPPTKKPKLEVSEAKVKALPEVPQFVDSSSSKQPT